MKCLVAIVFLLGALALGAERPLTPEEAKKHVGQTAEVCGIVADARYDPRAKDQPTYLYVEKTDPKHAFTIVLFGDDRRDLKGKRVCATGRITSFRGRLQISNPASFLPAMGMPAR